jgi:AcrR family transcriptional regulator
MRTNTGANASPLSGRRAQAARNDQLILDAARAVFTADPGAPIAAVATHAGVGIGALYRRYQSKDELLQRLATGGLQNYIDAAEAALTSDGDPWTAFAQFMRRCLDGGAGSLSVRLAGSFTPTGELHRLAGTAHEATRRLVDRTKSAGALRPDIEPGDIQLLFEQLQAIHVNDPDRTAQLRHRYLALLLDALHTPPAPPAGSGPPAPPLPGPAPRWEEITQRYNNR